MTPLREPTRSPTSMSDDSSARCTRPLRKLASAATAATVASTYVNAESLTSPDSVAPTTAPVDAAISVATPSR